MKIHNLILAFILVILCYIVFVKTQSEPRQKQATQSEATQPGAKKVDPRKKFPRFANKDNRIKKLKIPRPGNKAYKKVRSGFLKAIKNEGFQISEYRYDQGVVRANLDRSKKVTHYSIVWLSQNSSCRVEARFTKGWKIRSTKSFC